MNESFLMATSSRKIKSHVVESQITLLVWPCLIQLQKNIAQLITWLFLMIQSVSFSSVAFEASMFFSICLGEKNAEAIKFLDLEDFLSFTNFQTWFHNAYYLLYLLYIIYYIIYGPWIYITGQINSRILELLLGRFCCLIFATSQNLNML